MSEDSSKFPGFPAEPSANYWPYPRVMDGWWHILTGSEQKVLDYVLRHTWGYKKNADYISYSQFSYGIRTKAGKQIDKGCGIKHRGTLRKAIDGLIRKGFLTVVRKNGRVTYFQLRWEAQGLNKGGASNERVGGSGAEQTIKDYTNKDLQQLGSKNKFNEKPINKKRFYYKPDGSPMARSFNRWRIFADGEWKDFGGYERDIGQR